ncbi:MAG: glycosyltransferase family 39 protein [Alphaproteobacteria bacterium]|nr:glycosyltransferase family 39 protein [Alphaproteobacteria bacterium]
MLRWFHSRTFYQKSCLLIGLGILLYIPLMGGFNAWCDERFTLLTFQYSWSGMLQFLASWDVHPPLHYILLRLWMMGMDYHAVLWARLFSLFLLACTALLGVFPIRRLLGDKVALWFVGLTFVMPASFYLGTDIRMYALANLCVTGALVFSFLAAAGDRKSNWIFLGLFSICGLYTHYYCGLALLWVWGALGIRLALNRQGRRLIPFFVTGGIVSFAFLPWLFAFWMQAMHEIDGWWVDMSYANSSIGYFLHSTPYLFSPFYFWTMFFQALCWGWILLYWMNRPASRPKSVVAASLLVTAGLLMTAYAFSVIVRPILVSRYLLVLAGCFYLPLSIVLAQDKSIRRLFFILCGGAVLLLFFSRFYMVHASFFKDFQNLMRRYLPKDAIVIVDSTLTRLIFEFYLPEYPGIAYTHPDSASRLGEHRKLDRAAILHKLSETESIFLFTEKYQSPGYPLRSPYEFNTRYYFVKITPERARELLSQPEHVAKDHVELLQN